MQILVLIGTVGASPQLGEILLLCDFFDCPSPVLFSERELTFTFAMSSSVRLSSVCNVRAPSNFLGNPSVGGVKHKRGI